MNTDDLIDKLAELGAPALRGAAITRSLLWIAAASLAALALMALMMGVRPDLDAAVTGTMFWTKLSYTGSIALVAMLGILTLTRPEAAPPHRIALVLVPVTALAVVCVVEASGIDHDLWMDRWLGFSWRSCPVAIFTLALPIGAAFAFALRQFAPTHLRATGALAGLAAGALSAAVYSLHCPETGVAFLLTWYSLGIALVAVAGAVTGPRLLRW